MEEREAKLEVSKNVPGKRTSSHDSYLFMCFPHKKKHRRSYQKKNWWLNVWRLHSGIVLCDMGKNTHRKKHPRNVTWNPTMLPWKRRNIYSKLPKVVGFLGFMLVWGGEIISSHPNGRIRFPRSPLEQRIDQEMAR